MIKKIEENKTLDPKPEMAEKVVEKKLRPQRLNEFIGQEKIKEQLEIFLTAAQSRGDVGPYFVLWSAGFGKDDFSLFNGAGNELQHQNYFGTGIDPGGGFGVDSDRAEERGFLVYR